MGAICSSRHDDDDDAEKGGGLGRVVPGHDAVLPVEAAVASDSQAVVRFVPPEPLKSGKKSAVDLALEVRTLREQRTLLQFRIGSYVSYSKWATREIRVLDDELRTMYTTLGRLQEEELQLKRWRGWIARERGQSEV